MSRAEEFQIIRPGLFVWKAYEPAVMTVLSCVACQTCDGLVFIDPIPLQKSAEAELLGIAPPRAIVITSENHARAAEDYRSRFSIPICADASAARDFPFPVDHLVADGETILDDFTVISLAGAATGKSLCTTATRFISVTRSSTFRRQVLRFFPINTAPMRGSCGSRWENCCGFLLEY